MLLVLKTAIKLRIIIHLIPKLFNKKYELNQIFGADLNFLFYLNGVITLLNYLAIFETKT